MRQSRTASLMAGSTRNLDVTAGQPLGPFRHDILRNNRPLDLTDCIVRGEVRAIVNGAIADTALERLQTTIADDPREGCYFFGLTRTQVLALSGDEPRSYAWFCEMVMPGGRVVPLHYGELRVRPASQS